MTVEKFLKMQEGGVACVSIHQMPNDHINKGYSKTYFVEENREKIIYSEVFKK